MSSQPPLSGMSRSIAGDKSIIVCVYAILAGGMLFAVFPTWASAGVITYDFTGIVASVTDNVNFSLNGTIPIGASVTGTFAYDPNVPAGLDTPDTTFYPKSAVSLSLNIGNGLLVWNPAGSSAVDQVNVMNSPSGDSFGFVFDEAPPTNLILPSGATTSSPFGFESEIVLADNTGT